MESDYPAEDVGQGASAQPSDSSTSASSTSTADSAEHSTVGGVTFVQASGNGVATPPGTPPSEQPQTSE